MPAGGTEVRSFVASLLWMTNPEVFRFPVIPSAARNLFAGEVSSADEVLCPRRQSTQSAAGCARTPGTGRFVKMARRGRRLCSGGSAKSESGEANAPNSAEMYGQTGVTDSPAARPAKTRQCQHTRLLRPPAPQEVRRYRCGGTGCGCHVWQPYKVLGKLAVEAVGPPYMAAAILGSACKRSFDSASLRSG